MRGMKKKLREDWGYTPMASGPDLRVQAALAELNVPFEIDAENDFRITMAINETRSQTCYISSGTFEFMGFEFREIYSASLRSFGPFDPRTTDIMLQENLMLSFGFWCVARDDDDTHLALFKARVPSQVRGQPLLGILNGVCRTADAMELRLSGRDEY